MTVQPAKALFLQLQTKLSERAQALQDEAMVLNTYLAPIIFQLAQIPVHVLTIDAAGCVTVAAHVPSGVNHLNYLKPLIMQTIAADQQQTSSTNTPDTKTIIKKITALKFVYQES